MNKENNIGSKIKEARQLMGFTQEELAEKADMDSKHLSKIENGLHLPSYNTLKKLSAILNFNLENSEIISGNKKIDKSIYLKSIKILNSAKNDEEMKYYYMLLKIGQKGLSLK